MKPQPKVKKQRFAKCKSCGGLFAKSNSAHRACSLGCAVKLAKLDRQKREQKAYREQKVKQRTRRDWLKLAQSVANQYARLRDKKHGCISCDRGPEWGGQWHASHFRSVGAASAVRFNLWNIHKSCSICNNWKSGNLSEYEPRLRAKIGDEKVDWLRTQNQPVTYSVEYLQRFIKVAKKKIKRLTVSNQLR
jgi:hypothetical protein